MVNIIFPLAAQHVPAISSSPMLVARTSDLQGRPAPIYFERVVRQRSEDPASSLRGVGRLHTELIILRAVGVDVVNLSPGGRLAGRFFVDAMLPIVLVLAASLLTRPPAGERVDQFVGKMKTPVGATPELETVAMEATQREPHRFDHRKFWPKSAWEWTRWDEVDTVGFATACGITLAILTLFWGLLRWAEL